MKSTTLLEWEAKFREALRTNESDQNHKAGILLPAIPSHEDWDAFLDSVKIEWKAWRRDLSQLPYCLVVLYGGLAFYEYDESRFWPEFAKAVGSDSLLTNHQGEINSAFAIAARNCGLKIRRRESSTDYVGSAVHHIGVPLSLWDGFLEVCKWALRQDDWKGLSEEEWSEAILKRTGGRTRLKNFLLDNRETASMFIQEMHDARKKLSEDQRLTINDLKQASLLRQEYFDEVPETADFLRPSNPESLFQDRARLVWDADHWKVRLDLPAVARDELPAIWKIGALTQQAAATPNTLTLNSEAFFPWLFLKLTTGQQSKLQRLRGIAPWGLFDIEGNRFINPDRHELPFSRYVLISPEKLDDISRKGFDVEEIQENELCDFGDGDHCYVTYLWPVSQTAEFSFTCQGKKMQLRFSPAEAEIAACLFVGEGQSAAHFIRTRDKIRTEKLPLLCVAIPHGYFINPYSSLQNKFNVVVDGPQTDQIFGRWEKDHEDGTREFFFWRWIDRTIKQKQESHTVNSFKELNPKNFESPNPAGLRTIYIKAPSLDIEFPPYPIEMLVPQPILEACWENLPGAFLPWFILCQSPSGMTWDDILLTRDILAPGEQISFPLLQKYAKYGLLMQQGQRWEIADSRAVLKSSTWEHQVRFCGDPSVLWGLYRYVLSSVGELKRRIVWRPGKHRPLRTLPSVEVISEQRQPPFLFMRWRSDLAEKVKTYLRAHNVHIVSDLWRP